MPACVCVSLLIMVHVYMWWDTQMSDARVAAALLFARAHLDCVSSSHCSRSCYGFLSYPQLLNPNTMLETEGTHLLHNVRLEKCGKCVPWNMWARMSYACRYDSHCKWFTPTLSWLTKLSLADPPPPHPHRTRLIVTSDKHARRAKKKGNENKNVYLLRTQVVAHSKTGTTDMYDLPSESSSQLSTVGFTKY